MLVKLRPFVRQFLEEANEIFDLYVYTKGSRDYAAEVVNLIDPQNIFLPSKVFSRLDCQNGQKSLDVVPGSKASMIIPDDKLKVWREEDRESLIEIKRSDFFASSSRSQHEAASMAELRIDEVEGDGLLASIMCVLKTCT